MIGSASGIRNSRFCVVAGILFGGLVLCGTVTVQAQDLQVTPMSWDYGNVVAGTSETKTFDLLAGWPTAVWTYVVYLSDVPWYDYDLIGAYSGAFSIDAISDPLPLEMPEGKLVTVDVTFAPPSPGDYSVYLVIFSNDSIGLPGPLAFLPLEGTGVSATVPAPGALLLGGWGIAAVGWLRRRRTLE